MTVVEAKYEITLLDLESILPKIYTQHYSSRPFKYESSGFIYRDKYNLGIKIVATPGQRFLKAVSYDTSLLEKPKFKKLKRENLATYHTHPNISSIPLSRIKSQVPSSDDLKLGLYMLKKYGIFNNFIFHRYGIFQFRFEKNNTYSPEQQEYFVNLYETLIRKYYYDLDVNIKDIYPYFESSTSYDRRDCNECNDRFIVRSLDEKIGDYCIPYNQFGNEHYQKTCPKSCKYDGDTNNCIDIASGKPCFINKYLKYDDHFNMYTCKTYRNDSVDKRKLLRETIRLRTREFLDDVYRSCSTLFTIEVIPIDPVNLKKIGRAHV